MLNEKNLFFIVGLARSGTTLLQEIQNTFDDFCNTNESRIDGPGFISCWKYVYEKNNFSYLEKFIETNWTKNFFVEKTPDSIDCLPQILNRYPNANFIFLERDPLKVLFSQLNLFLPEADERNYHIKYGIMNETDRLLSNEHYHAKLILKRIQNQKKFKPYFKKKITIRYEDLLNFFEKTLKQLENEFGIKSNLQEAQLVMTRPSLSSKDNKYSIQSLYDHSAISIINEAQQLWDYKLINKNFINENMSESQSDYNFIKDTLTITISELQKKSSKIKSLEQKIKSIENQDTSSLYEHISELESKILDLQTRLDNVHKSIFKEKSIEFTEEIVEKAYREILKRSPDSTGKEYYIKKLVNLEISESELRKLILNSEESRHIRQNVDIL